jgi:ketosteroid isomerase-like protein
MTLPEFAQGHFTAAVSANLEAIVEAYAVSDKTYVFVEGPRWSTIGYENIAKGWAGYVNSPIRLQKIEFVEGPLFKEYEMMGWIGFICELTVEIKGKVFPARFRGTFVCEKDAQNEWKIVHEHFSQPAQDPYGIGDWL